MIINIQMIISHTSSLNKGLLQHEVCETIHLQNGKLTTKKEQKR